MKVTFAPKGISQGFFQTVLTAANDMLDFLFFSDKRLCAGKMQFHLNRRKSYLRKEAKISHSN